MPKGLEQQYQEGQAQIREYTRKLAELSQRLDEANTVSSGRAALLARLQAMVTAAKADLQQLRKRGVDDLHIRGYIEGVEDAIREAKRAG